MSLTAACERHLSGVHPDLIAVVRKASALSSISGGQPFKVIEGRRSLSRQRELYRRGASRTMNSRHLHGLAVDLMALVSGRGSWQVTLYYGIRNHMLAAAAELGIRIVWGGDWDGDGDSHDERFFDGPHFELARSVYPDGADPLKKAGAPAPVITAPAKVPVLLQPGSKGTAVVILQGRLKQMLGRDILVDGQYGPQTYDAVREAQADCLLPVTGLVDPKTAKALGL